MEPTIRCRNYALQCFNWAADQEDKLRQCVLVACAREWLQMSERLEQEPWDYGRVVIRTKLH
jgi:hypothetical protein